jgi:hypothetical protein
MLFEDVDWVFHLVTLADIVPSIQQWRLHVMGSSISRIHQGVNEDE